MFFPVQPSAPHERATLPGSLLALALGLPLFCGCGSPPDPMGPMLREPSPSTQPGSGGPADPTREEALREELYLRARTLEEQGLAAEAIATYTEVLSEFGEHEDARERRGRLADALGMSLAELLVPERPQAASAPSGSELAGALEPRLPPNPSALDRGELWNELYERALRCERDHRYLTAIDVYDELLKGRGSYKDAALRRTTLIQLQRLAEQLYARGVAAETDDEALDNFEQIEIFWPDFRDIPGRLAELRDD